MVAFSRDIGNSGSIYFEINGDTHHLAYRFDSETNQKEQWYSLSHLSHIVGVNHANQRRESRHVFHLATKNVKSKGNKGNIARIVDLCLIRRDDVLRWLEKIAKKKDNLSPDKRANLEYLINNLQELDALVWKSSKQQSS